MDKKLKITLALGVATLLFTGCGGGSDSTTPPPSTGTTISGTIDTGAGSSVIRSFTGDRAITDTTNIKILRVTPDFEMETYAVNANGTFSAPIDTTQSSAFFIVNDLNKTIISTLSIPVASGSSTTVDMLPAGKVTQSLTLGTLAIDETNKIAKSTNATVENAMNNDEAVKGYATLDDTSKLYANIYRNPHFALIPQYVNTIRGFDGTSTLGINNVIDQFLDFNSTARIMYGGVKTTINADYNLTEGSDNLKIYFPANNQYDINYAALDTEDTWMPREYLHLTAQNNTNLFGYRHADDGSDKLKKNDGNDYESDRLFGSLPSGEYILKSGTDTLAKFDLVTVNPFENNATSVMSTQYDESNATAPIYTKLPALTYKLNTTVGDSTKVDSVTFRFVQSNGTTYSKVDDDVLTLLAKNDKENFHFYCELYEDSSYNTRLGMAINPLGFNVVSNDITLDLYDEDINVDSDAIKVSVPKSSIKRISCGYGFSMSSYEFLIHDDLQ